MANPLGVVDFGWKTIGVHPPYRGNGGGPLENNRPSSGTSPAGVQFDIPVFQTSVVFVTSAEPTFCCKAPRSNGPACCPLIAAKYCAAVGSGGGPPATCPPPACCCP